MRNHPTERKRVRRVILAAVGGLALLLGSTLIEESSAAGAAPLATAAPQSRFATTRPVTSRVNYRRATGAQGQALKNRLRNFASQPPGADGPRLLGEPRKLPNGITAARLDPLSVMSFSVLEKDSAGEVSVTCTSASEALAQVAAGASQKGGRQ